MSPKMWAMSGFVGTNSPNPIWFHFIQFFPRTGNNQKANQYVLHTFLGGPMAAILPWCPMFVRGGCWGWDSILICQQPSFQIPDLW